MQINLLDVLRLDVDDPIDFVYCGNDVGPDWFEECVFEQAIVHVNPI